MHLLGRHLVFKDERGATVREVPRGSEGAPLVSSSPRCSPSLDELCLACLQAWSAARPRCGRATASSIIAT